MADIVKIKSTEYITHDVLRIVTEKPTNLVFQTGQAAEVSINKNGWEKELRAFTFTSLPQDNFVEFTVKTYPSHNGVTNQLRALSAGAELIIGNVFGDIQYKGEGVFIAGGAGVTPFIAILNQLEKENSIGQNVLIFANKTRKDIILKERFRTILGENFINILSKEIAENMEHGYITLDIIKKNIKGHKYFYLCGPEQMMEDVSRHLKSIGIQEDYIIKESF